MDFCDLPSPQTSTDGLPELAYDSSSSRSSSISSDDGSVGEADLAGLRTCATFANTGTTSTASKAKGKQRELSISTTSISNFTTNDVVLSSTSIDCALRVQNEVYDDAETCLTAKAPMHRNDRANSLPPTPSLHLLDPLSSQPTHPALMQRSHSMPNTRQLRRKQRATFSEFRPDVSLPQMSKSLLRNNPSLEEKALQLQERMAKLRRHVSQK